MSRQPPTSPHDGADAPADPRELFGKAVDRVSATPRTPFDHLDGFAVLTASEVAARMRIDPRSVRRAVARGNLVASRSCGLRILAADAAGLVALTIWPAIAAGGFGPRTVAGGAATGHTQPACPHDGPAAAAAAFGTCSVSRRRAVPSGIEVRSYRRRDGTTTDSFAVRFTEPSGLRRRRTFDRLEDALDFQAKRRSAKRWRPDELRQESAGSQTLREFFEQWWLERAMAELARSTLSVYRCLWEAHVEPRLGACTMREIDARRVVAFRGELLAAGVGPTSVVKTMAMLQRVFRDAVEYGDLAFNAFKLVRKPAPGPTREARPLTPLQVECLAADLDLRGYAGSAVLVRLMAYSGLRPQEALGLHWYAVRDHTLLVELANADGRLERLKNRKRSRKRSRTVDLMAPVRDDLGTWRRSSGNPGEDRLVLPHEHHGGLWLDEQYRTWRRRMFVPSAEKVGLPSKRPYDLRHTWASLRIAEKQLSIAELAEQLGDRTSTVLDTYTHVMNEWRQRRGLDIEREIRRARVRVNSTGG